MFHDIWNNQFLSLVAMIIVLRSLSYLSKIGISIFSNIRYLYQEIILRNNKVINLQSDIVSMFISFYSFSELCPTKWSQYLHFN